MAGRIADAERVVANALRRHPAHAEALLGRAEVARLQGDTPAALQAVRAAMEVERKHDKVNITIRHGSYGTTKKSPALTAGAPARVAKRVEPVPPVPSGS